jgi:hypothetical protein
VSPTAAQDLHSAQTFAVDDASFPPICPESMFEPCAQPVHNMNIIKLLTYEWCSGSAQLSRHLSLRGFNSLGIDHDRNRHKVLAPTIKLDLSSSHGQSIASEMHSSQPAFFN